MIRPATHLATIYMLVFALIFNAMTSASVYASDIANQSRVLFCTSQGYEWVNVETDSETGQSTQLHCKLCLFPPNDDNVSDFIVESYASTIFANSQPLADEIAHPLFKIRFAHQLAQSRAPPIPLLLT
jgi:hypothetical protein